MKIEQGCCTFSQLDKFPITALFTSGRANYSFLYGEAQSLPVGTSVAGVIENRKKFLAQVGIDPSGLICLDQVHGSRIVRMDKFDRGKGALSQANEIPNCDGAYTLDAQTPIAVFTADCLSLFFYEPNKNVIGIAHAGWRGSFERIASKMVKALVKDCGANPREMIVAFGPCIRECCYQVGEELAEYFPNSVDKRKGAFYLDLFRENKSQLLSEGVKEKNIFDSGICTACENKNFFSYRFEKENAGRMMSLVMLK